MSEKLNSEISKFSFDQRLRSIRGNKKTEDYLMLAITLSSLIFFIIFIIKPSTTIVLELNQKLKDYKNLSIRLEEKIKNLEQIKMDQENLRSEFTLLNMAIADSPSESVILNNLNYVASQNNVQISDFYFAVDDEKAKTKIKFNATGTYENIILMFYGFDNVLTPFNINSIDLKPEIEYGNDIIKLSVEGESYYLTE